MKKLLNDPYAYASETLEGLCRAHPQYYRFSDGSRQVVVRPDSSVSGKVGIVTGGGSGHLPVFVGYVGRGLLNACAVGDVFASPSADDMAIAMRAADGGADHGCCDHGFDRIADHRLRFASGRFDCTH